MRKYLVPITVTLLIIGVVVLLLRQNINSKKDTSGSSKKKAIPLSYIQQAESIISWLDTERIEENKTYAERQACDTKGNCRKLYKDHRLGALVIWAEAELYKKTKNETLRERMNNDMDIYLDPKKVLTIQPYLWHCRFLLDMADDPLWLPEKDKLNKLCDRGRYGVITRQFSSKTEQTIQEIIANLSQGKEPLLYADGFHYNPKLLTNFATQTSEFAAMYLYEPKKNFYEDAFVMYLTALEEYAENKKSGADLSMQAPYLTVATIDMYRMTSDKRYLGFAEILFKNHIDTKPCDDPKSCVLSMFAYRQMHAIEKKPETLDKQKERASYMYDNYFDREGIEGYVTGRGSVRFLQDGWMVYDTATNALLAGLLVAL
ncbi:hypothetical protein A2334_01555 [Candidatus Roizmanbacteria bacterium RIFOXYB2_FULL_38_10]|uniref:Uncharacterized protein n=1 Tax=Candidatus Roizmanbacteria bacterium RIFOXYD1_FULL_38_12 TaxID=1802093 RepID=A0A1F7L242_9BACT|nr:MAG: hypothetical protein A3K47_05505 [Candidatus Roizmanbacteria bacterium RIFOXYA2_FULL_38_14]OGK64200.1 MAG: hypothetical protein A3K27_05505 [Candidatus Roizmanbacteria bacterium RIFOXYA1_FULL_37_12]OGK66046.1 MAG: hypothetical protein A3K38_05505 [Candidatus Roizmanbacteria bacterium RIFOXYB1_FULL_40_23]OGK68535.1 MAG: hypothetical protein A2334_01555 [Candidatus Roizmanbacteria bacterium RIFOXYB2_FULL_38_10]OGK70451.1 MAG: hypothetical protein A3K21_05510 [Candidatus Roizmanbacteria ba